MVYGPIANVYTSIYFFIQGVGIPDAAAAPPKSRWVPLPVLLLLLVEVADKGEDSVHCGTSQRPRDFKFSRWPGSEILGGLGGQEPGLSVQQVRSLDSGDRLRSLPSIVPKSLDGLLDSESVQVDQCL